MHKVKAWKSDERGSIILEFSLVFPLFLALVFGIFTIAAILYNDAVAQAAARDAARAAAVTGDVWSAEAKGERVLAEGGLSATAAVDVSGLSTGRATATVDAQVPVLVPGFAALVGGNFWDTSLNLQRATSYYVEYRHQDEPESYDPVCVGYWCQGW